MLLKAMILFLVSLKLNFFAHFAIIFGKNKNFMHVLENVVLSNMVN